MSDSESDAEWPPFYQGVAVVEGDNSNSYVDVLAFIETADADKGSTFSTLHSVVANRDT
jgi:hypothetical protein